MFGSHRSKHLCWSSDRNADSSQVSAASQAPEPHRDTAQVCRAPPCARALCDAQNVRKVRRPAARLCAHAIASRGSRVGRSSATGVLAMVQALLAYFVKVVRHSSLASVIPQITNSIISLIRSLTHSLTDNLHRTPFCLDIVCWLHEPTESMPRRQSRFTLRIVSISSKSRRSLRQHKQSTYCSRRSLPRPRARRTRRPSTKLAQSMRTTGCS